MKLVMLVALLGGALAAPQGLDPDAETVLTPERSPLPQDVGNGTIVIINPAFFDILRGLFGGGGGGDVFENSDPVDAPPQDSGRLPSLFDHPFLNVLRGPFFGGSPVAPPVMTNFDDLPDNYDNSTYEVKVVNGSRVEVNRTVTKQTGDNGVFITHFHSVRRLPGADGEPAADDGDQAPETDAVPAENRVEPSETSGVSEEPSLRHRRWILKWLRETLKRPSDHKHDIDSHESHLNGLDLPSDRDVYSVGAGGALESEEATSDGGRTFFVPIRNHDDVAVNYIQPLPINPDAEVIDPDLVREDKRRFFESRAEPLSSQPMRSQPMMMSQPMRSQPMMMSSRPMRSQPMMMSRPMRSQPMMMSQPMRSQPIRL